MARICEIITRAILAVETFFVLFTVITLTATTSGVVNAQQIGLELQFYSDDPNIKWNTTQILEARGFQSEIHEPITEDGYILTMIRVINPYVKNRAELRPILIQHGLVCNSDFFLLSRPARMTSSGEYVNENGTVTDCSGVAAETVGTSPAMVLAACGYDVWIGNYRGNRYSKGHIILNQDEPEYWGFTIDELGLFDLPAQIHHVLTHTGRSTLGYIGHSMGTTGMFQLLSARPEYSDMIRPFIALAPVARVGAIEAPILQIAAHSPEIYSLITTERKPLFGLTSALWGDFLGFVGRYFCGNSLLKPICSFFVFAVCGFDIENTDESLIPQVYGHTPDDTGIRVVGHFGQRVVHNNFQFFDYGPLLNQKFYGSQVSPTYNLSAIRSDSIVLISSIGDYLADPMDVDYIRSRLTIPPYADYVIPYDAFNHIDFVIGENVGTLQNAFILRTLRDLYQ